MLTCPRLHGELGGLGPECRVEPGLHQLWDLGQITFCPGPPIPHLSVEAFAGRDGDGRVPAQWTPATWVTMGKGLSRAPPICTLGCHQDKTGDAHKGPTETSEGGPWTQPLPHHAPPSCPSRAQGCGKGRPGAGGISPGSPSWRGAFNRILPGSSPAPSQAPGQARVCRGDLGWPGCLSFGGSFACFPAALKPGGRSTGLPAPREQMGGSGKAAAALRGLAPFFPPFVPLPGPLVPRPQRPLVWLPLGAQRSQLTAAPLES